MARRKGGSGNNKQQKDNTKTKKSSEKSVAASVRKDSKRKLAQQKQQQNNVLSSIFQRHGNKRNNKAQGDKRNCRGPTDTPVTLEDIMSKYKIDQQQTQTQQNQKQKRKSSSTKRFQRSEQKRQKSSLSSSSSSSNNNKSKKKHEKKISIELPSVNCNGAPWIHNNNFRQDHQQSVSSFSTTTTAGTTKASKKNSSYVLISPSLTVSNEQLLTKFDLEMQQFASFVTLSVTECQARDFALSQIKTLATNLFPKPCSAQTKFSGKHTRFTTNYQDDTSDDNDNDNDPDPQLPPPPPSTVECQVFGSYATKGVCTFESDVDIALWGIVDPPPPPSARKKKSSTKKASKQQHEEKHKNIKKQQRVLQWKQALDKQYEITVGDNNNASDKKKNHDNHDGNVGPVSAKPAAKQQQQHDDKLSNQEGTLLDSKQALIDKYDDVGDDETHVQSNVSLSNPTNVNNDSDNPSSNNGDEPPLFVIDKVGTTQSNKESPDGSMENPIVLECIDESIETTTTTRTAAMTTMTKTSADELDGNQTDNTKSLQQQQTNDDHSTTSNNSYGSDIDDDDDSADKLENYQQKRQRSTKDKFDAILPEGVPDAHVTTGSDTTASSPIPPVAEGTALSNTPMPDLDCDQFDDADDDEYDQNIYNDFDGSDDEEEDDDEEGNQFEDAEGDEFDAILRYYDNECEEGDNNGDDDDEAQEQVGCAPPSHRRQRRPRVHSVVSLSSSTTGSEGESSWDESGMQVSYVVKPTPEKSKPTFGPVGKTRVLVIGALKTLSKSLRKCSWTEHLHVRQFARVPIINITTKFGYECDIALGGHNGTDTSSYALESIQRYKSFATVVLVLKVLLTQQNLDKPFTGGLGSFKLYVLVAHHLNKHLSMGGTDRPSEILLSFLFRYGQIQTHSQQVHPSARTTLSNDLILECHGGEADMGGVYQVETCIRLFRACWVRLWKLLTQKTTVRTCNFSFLSYIIDSNELEERRMECQEKAMYIQQCINNGGVSKPRKRNNHVLSSSKKVSTPKTPPSSFTNKKKKKTTSTGSSKKKAKKRKLSMS